MEDTVLTPQQRALADQLFAEASALPQQQRYDWLNENCDDAEVRREVEDLLAFASQPLDGMSEAIRQLAGSLAKLEFFQKAMSLDAGQQFGPYRLIRQVGRGGSADVWEADNIETKR